MGTLFEKTRLGVAVAPDERLASFLWVSGGSTVEDRSTTNPEIESSNPAVAKYQEKRDLINYFRCGKRPLNERERERERER